MFEKLKTKRISTRESTDSIDDKTFERQQRQVLNVAQKYEKVLSNTTKREDIQLASKYIEGGILGYCAVIMENGELKQRIVLDKKQYSNYDKITKTVNNGVDKG